MTEVATKLGQYVIIEGNEGVGKSTLRDALHKRLVEAGHDVVLVREPGGTPRAENLREQLKAKREYPMSNLEELFLFCAARDDVYRNVIAPALAEGKVVLADRGYFSSYALQVHPYIKGDHDILLQLFNVATGAVWQNLGGTPGIQIALTLDEEVRQARMAARPSLDALEDKSPEVLAKIAEAYTILTQQPGVLVFDGAMDIDELADKAYDQIVVCFEQRETEAAIAAERAAEAAALKETAAQGGEAGEPTEPEAPKEITIDQLQDLILGEIAQHANQVAAMFGDITKIEPEWKEQLEVLHTWVKRHMDELRTRTEPMFEMEAHQRTQQISNNCGQMLAAWLSLTNIKLLNAAALEPKAPEQTIEEQAADLGVELDPNDPDPQATLDAIRQQRAEEAARLNEQGSEGSDKVLH